jgi:hypothetical protein
MASDPYRSQASIPQDASTLERLLASARARKGVRVPSVRRDDEEPAYSRSALTHDLLGLSVLLIVAGFFAVTFAVNYWLSHH